MRMSTPHALALAAFAAIVPAAKAEHERFIIPVTITYVCPTQTGSLPACTTSYQVPYGRLLVVQDVNGSATPINPNAAGNFATDQASATLTTQVGDEPAVTNTIGPHYAINNSAVWNFHDPSTFYTQTTPAVKNNGGSVVIQGYLIGY